jgi:hypothetical protein
LFGSAAEFRPVRPIDEGTHVSASLFLRRDDRSAAGGGWTEARLTLAGLDGEAEGLSFARPEVSAGYGWSRSERRARIDVGARGGWSFGDVPRQDLVLVGGRGTLPGFDHRSFGGDRFALAEMLASADLTHPWLRGRLFAATGVAGVGRGGERGAELWGVRGTGGPRASVGLGLGIFYDLLQVDLARGLGSDGRNQLIVEFQRAFWDLL